jgi:hypothetical protein
MRFVTLVAFLLTVVCPLTAVGGKPSHVTANITIYKGTDRFAGWPANHGIWAWDNEIVVGFILGYHKEQEGHTIDSSRPSPRMQARSLDGGYTWAIEETKLVNTEGKVRDSTSMPKPLDFTDPNFAAWLMHDQFFYSLDRGHTWEGPFTLPKFGRPGLLARTDYLIEGKHRLTAFIAAQKETGDEGQPLCIRTIDGGRTWNLVGWIGKQPPKNYGYAIMPATVALKGSGYLSIIRRGGVFDGEKRWWLESFLSPDDGHSWYMLDQPKINNAGNPATLTRMKDGRIAMAYGWRAAPYGIRARVTADEGQTWSREFALRADGMNWDLGYPRTAQRADGQLVTIYYFNDHDQRERYLAATIWNPDKMSD